MLLSVVGGSAWARSSLPCLHARVKYAYLDGAPVLSLITVAVNVCDMKFTADAINNGFDFLSVIDWQSVVLVLPYQRFDRIGYDWTAN